MRNLRFAGLALVAAVALLAASAAVAMATQLVETGSTLLYPIMSVWASSYHATDPDVQIDTAGTGSGAGIRAAVAGSAQIGGSDAYLSDAQMKKTPLLNIPLAVSAQLVVYNIPEIGSANLNLTGSVLAGIYSGAIVNWDDPKIVALNGSTGARLPHRTIRTIRRSDSSGDTFLFTQFLCAEDAAWKSGPGFGTHVSWPAVPQSATALFNRGVLDTLRVSPYSIGYVGISYLKQATQFGLGYAALQNAAGKFVLPTAGSLRSAAGAVAAKTPADERVSLINAAGEGSYPIVNFEYAIVNPKQTDAGRADALKKFLTWVISPDGGSKSYMLDAVDFIALPGDVAEKSKAQIAKIQ